MINFPSIEQFRNVIKNVQHRARWAGTDENGEPIFKRGVILPTLKFLGTVKCHGTNSAVVLEKEDGELWFQSRNNVITPESDNAGFARYMAEQVGEKVLRDQINGYRYLFGIDKNEQIAVFGEWCGKGIQKGVAISEVDKMFIVFAIRVGVVENCEWFGRDELSLFKLKEKRIFNIMDFPTFEMDIDFENPHLAQNELIKLTEEVERECPVGKAFGVSGTGEGIVWTCQDDNYRGGNFLFKVKGEAHSASKVKTLAAVDVERINNINELVDSLVTEQRLNQGIEYLKEQHLEIDNKNMGPFLKWVAGDCMKEDKDTIVENGFEPKDIGKAISNKARVWFLRYVEEDTFNA